MSVRVTLSGDGWLDLKERLKVKDKRAVLGFAVDGFSADGKDYKFNVLAHQVGNAAVRITNWSIPGAKPYPIAASFEQRTAAIDDLYADVFDEVMAAVTKFEADQAQKDDAEKNATADGGTV